MDVLTRTNPRKLVKTVQSIVAEVDRLVEEGITERELRRTEESVFTQMHLAMDSPLDMANWFGIEELLIEPTSPDTPEAQAEKLRGIGRDEVAAVLRKIFSPDRRNLVAIGPCGWLSRRRIRRLLARA